MSRHVAGWVPDTQPAQYLAKHKSAEHTQAATVLVGDTYETPTGAAEYAQSEREALAFLGDEKCAAELAEHTQAACDTIKAASE